MGIQTDVQALHRHREGTQHRLNVRLPRRVQESDQSQERLHDQPDGDGPGAMKTAFPPDFDPQAIPDPCTIAIRRPSLIISDYRLLWRERAQSAPREGAT